jgi:CubicO group peptidase (beta-lactamase class C family)
MKLLRISSLLVAWLILLSSTHAQSPTIPAVSAKMKAFLDSQDLAGVVTVVGRKTGVIHLDAQGYRSLEAKDPMKPDTLFRIASMTKPMTAMAIMMLADDGKLSPEDPVEKYLPEFKGQMLQVSRDKDKTVLQKSKRPITLRDLMTHTSGLPAAYPAVMGDVYLKRNWTLKETTLVISQQPLQFEPGTKWSYCNAGIDVLGRVVEVLSGQSFESFLKARLFDPLGMKDTLFYPQPEQFERVASLYSKDKNQLVLVKNPFLDAIPKGKHPIPAGGLFSTGPDLAKLYQALLLKGELNGKRVISEKSLAEMTRTQTGDIPTGFTNGMSFGFGFAVVKEPKEVTAMLSPGTFGHGGAFATQGWVDPVQDLFVVLLIQRNGLPNGDASPMRKALQEAAVEAIKK